jgi:hypothetical protein
VRKLTPREAEILRDARPGCQGRDVEDWEEDEHNELVARGLLRVETTPDGEDEYIEWTTTPTGMMALLVFDALKEGWEA